MNRSFTKLQFLQEIADAVIRHRLDDDHVVAAMILFHCFRFKLAPDILLTDAPSAREIGGLARSHTYEFIAKAFRSEAKRRSIPDYWRAEYEHRAFFELAESVTPEWQERVDNVVTLLQLEGLIIGVISDD